MRGSRRLSDAPDRVGVGPIDYEVIEPYRRVRFACAANDVVPVSFEWIFDAEVPPRLERRDRHHARRGNRIDVDVLRYHQIGVASGWVEVDGMRTEITPDTWFTTRDHSWGVRQDVGLPADRHRRRPPERREREPARANLRPEACRSGSRGARCCSSGPTARGTRSITSTD